MGLLQKLRSLPKRSFFIAAVLLLLLPVAAVAATGNRPLYTKIAPAKSCDVLASKLKTNLSEAECTERNLCVDIPLNDKAVTPGDDHEYHVLRGGLWQFYQKQKEFKTYGQFGYGCYGSQDIMKVELYLL